MTLWQDVRFAGRALTKARGLTAVALMTLALGIGANTAIFSIVNAVLLRPLPFHDAGQLVQIRAEQRGLGLLNIGFSVPEMEDLRDRAGIFQMVSGVWPAPANLTGGERPERIDILGVSPNYFTLLGARPQLGRLFDSRDIADGFAEAAVISDGLWQREFGGDRSILGRQVRIDNDLYTIVGVLPPDFRHPGPATARAVDLWATAGFRADPFPPSKRNIHLIPEMVARLKPGVKVEDAQSRLQVFFATLRNEFAGDYPAQAGWMLKLAPLKDTVVGGSHSLLVTLLLAVGAILLIACVNVASLLLASGSARQREIAVRMALGARRSRIVRQMLTESAVLGLSAAVVGVIAAVATENALLAMLPAQVSRVNAIGIDGPVLLFTLGVAVATSFLFGLAPAAQAAKAGLEGLREGGRAGSGMRSARTRKILVAAETALSLMLVVGAGLLLRTFLDLLQVRPGFNSQNVLAASMWLPVPNDPKTDVYASTTQRTTFVREIVRRLHSVSGVTDAALSSVLPLRDAIAPGGFRVEGRPEQGDTPSAAGALVTPDFMRTLGVTLVSGRMLQQSDDEHAPQVVLVDQAAVRQLWSGQNPLGKRLRFATDILVNGKLQPAPWMTVVGVVNNIKFARLDEQETAHVYLSMYQRSGRLYNIVVRATGDPAAVGQQIQQQVRSVDPNLPVSDVSAMRVVVASSLADRRFAAMLIGIFAVVALALASVGVYGLTSYSVSQRSRELGIRAALGASRRNLVRLMLQQGMLPVAIGLAAGCAGALVMGRWLSGMLFGVKATDPLVFLAAFVALALFGLGANYLPARRAGRVDPNQALRAE
ncbi:MAG TPA: ABC transporter permease [Candidatus Angelobacter sp.]|nr:ABC transporter permease [Candidatus Angelobacter sp.]